MKQKLLPPLIFAALACYLLLMYYSEMLVTAQLRTPFLAGALFRAELLSEPFGWMSYLGCWLTQHLYHPVVGVLLWLMLWLASWKAGAKALGLGHQWSVLMMLPLGCLVLSVTDVGYWIYCLKMHGYWFSQSLGFLACMTLLWLMGQVKHTLLNDAVLALACIVLYPVLGWYAYLLAGCMVLKYRNWWCLSTLLAPALWQQTLYPGKSMYVMWKAGFPIFENNALLSLRPSVPFIALSVLVLLLALIPLRHRALSLRQWTLTTSAVTLLTAVMVWVGSFKDYNYLAEMRMTQYAMADDWHGVLDEARKSPRPSRTMVALKNIALANVGQLGDKSYALGNDGRDITNPDSLNVNIMQIACPVVYYNYGMTNYAARWCIENSVSYGYSPYHLQLLVRCAVAGGEDRLAQRYLSLLHSMAYYADWNPRPVSRMVAQLRAAFANVIDADANSCERYLIDIFSAARGSDEPMVKELNLFYATLYGSPARFWTAFVAYAAAHPDDLLPQHYQEAYCSFMYNYPVELPFKVNVARLTCDNYQAFLRHYDACQQSGADQNTMAEAMRPAWGKTYWWHQCFGRSRY